MITTSKRPRQEGPGTPQLYSNLSEWGFRLSDCRSTHVLLTVCKDLESKETSRIKFGKPLIGPLRLDQLNESQDPRSFFLLQEPNGKTPSSINFPREGKFERRDTRTLVQITKHGCSESRNESMQRVMKQAKHSPNHQTKQKPAASPKKMSECLQFRSVGSSTRRMISDDLIIIFQDSEPALNYPLVAAQKLTVWYRAHDHTQSGEVTVPAAHQPFPQSPVSESEVAERNQFLIRHEPSSPWADWALSLAESGLL